MSLLFRLFGRKLDFAALVDELANIQSVKFPFGRKAFAERVNSLDRKLGAFDLFLRPGP